MKAKSLLLIVALFCLATAQAQNERPPLTADSLATGNYKDVLNSFFQLAFNRVISNEKEIRFTSNPFAVMAKLDTTMLVDTNYYRYRHLRDLNFSVAARLDTAYKFNGFSSTFKYALVNKRDETVSRAFLILAAEDKKIGEFLAVSAALDQYISGLPTMEEKAAFMQERTDFRQGKKTFDQLSPTFRTVFTETAKKVKAAHLLALIEEDPKLNLLTASRQVYNDLKNYFNNRLLWTVGVSDTTYKNNFLFSNVVVFSELVKGIDSLKNADIELNLKAAMQFVDDSLRLGRDLNRSVFSFEPGINFVLKTKNTLKSFFEFKLSGSYSHTFSGLYPDEKRDRLTLNSTLRLRIINDIWVPLEIKYDPASGNVFGFLNVRANFTGLSKLVGGAGK